MTNSDKITKQQVQDMPPEEFRECILRLANAYRFKDIEIVSKWRGGKRGNIKDR